MLHYRISEINSPYPGITRPSPVHKVLRLLFTWICALLREPSSNQRYQNARIFILGKGRSNAALLFLDNGSKYSRRRIPDLISMARSVLLQWSHTWLYITAGLTFECIYRGLRRRFPPFTSPDLTSCVRWPMGRRRDWWWPVLVIETLSPDSQSSTVVF